MMTNRLLPVVLLVSLLLAGCQPIAVTPLPTAPTPEPTATEQPALESAPVFEKTDCPFDIPENVPVECGYVVVPEDHNVPNGPSLRLAVIVLYDRSADHQPDPVIVLSGGPGEKTVANAQGLVPALAPLHPNRDFIIFDQRGVGLSQPALECPEFMQAQLEILDEIDANVSTKVIFDALMACRDRLLSEGHDLSVYNTRQSAADVDAIRRALGYDQINLYGGSYGSLLAQEVMRSYPDTIRSVVMNSVWPLEASFFVDAAGSTVQAVLHLLETCTADPGCSQAYPDLQQTLYTVIEQLDAEPVPVTLTSPLDGQDYAARLSGGTVFNNLVTFLYTTDIIPVLPQAIANVANGDYALMTQLSSTRLVLLDLTSRGMTFSVVCAEDLVGRTPEDLLAVRAQQPQVLLGDVADETIIEYGIFGICKNWPVPEADASINAPLVSDIPTLILEGEFDPVTPPAYGRLVAGHLGNSHYFELPGVGHNVAVNECARNIAGAFVADPSRAPDTACLEAMTGIVFDLPKEASEIVLEPFVDEERGFRGLVPSGWRELAPANLLRGSTALDPAYFVLEGTPGTAAELFANLAGQLGLEPGLAPVTRAEVGNFTWDFYKFERRGNPVDLALAEDGEKAYFVLLLSPPDEHDALRDQIFLPAVEAMASLAGETEEGPPATAEPTAEPTAFEKTACPMPLPTGVVEGEEIVCGRVTVPERHAAPDGPTIRLAVAVIPSSNADGTSDPLVMLAGGPGESALTSFTALLATPGFEGFWADRDVVLVEQRGTRYATPFLACDELFQATLDMLDENLTYAARKERRLAAFAACRDRFVEAGVDLSAYNSIENAADIVRVADALGYAEFNLYGGSYGSLLAQHILRDHPERVRSAILDAASPLRHEPNLLYKAHSADRSLRLLFQRCAADVACNQAYPDLETVFFETVEKLNAQPAVLQLRHPRGGEAYELLLTGDRLIGLTRDLLYATNLLPELPKLLYDVANEDYTLLGLLQSSLLFQLQQTLANGMYQSVICSELSDFTRADLADPEGLYPQVARVTEELMVETFLDPCTIWQVDQLPEYASQPVAGDTPTLVLSGEFDPTVPPEVGKVAAEKLNHASVYAFPGVSHSTINGGDCPVSMMVAFVDDPTVAPDDACMAEMGALAFVVPMAAADIELEPFTNPEMSIGGMAPAGWTEVAPAVFARRSSATDQTALVHDAVDVAADVLLDALSQQLGLAQVPEKVGERTANEQSWTLYTVEVQGFSVDIAMAEYGEKTLVVLLQTPAAERDSLYATVFLPAVDALAPLAEGE